MDPSLLAEPGEEYDLEMVPDDGNWERVESPKPTNKKEK